MKDKKILNEKYSFMTGKLGKESDRGKSNTILRKNKDVSFDMGRNSSQDTKEQLILPAMKSRQLNY